MTLSSGVHAVVVEVRSEKISLFVFVLLVYLSIICLFYLWQFLSKRCLPRVWHKHLDLIPGTDQVYSSGYRTKRVRPVASYKG